MTFLYVGQMKANNLEIFNECMKKIAYVVESKHKSELSHFLRVYDKEEKVAFGHKVARVSKAFSMTCFAASFLFRKILDAKPISILITSGTLSPLEALDADLGIPFTQKI